MSPIWHGVFRRCRVCNGNFPLIGFYAASTTHTRVYKSWVCRLCRQTRKDKAKAENRIRVKAASVIRREGIRLSNPDRRGGPIIEAPGDLVSTYGWSVDRIERLLRHAFEGECIGCETPYAEMPNDLSNLTLDIRNPHESPWIETNVQPRR